MGKEAQPRHQLNIRFTGEEKAELLNNLDAYLSRYNITKADFIAICIQRGIDEDLANASPQWVMNDGQGLLDEKIQDAITPLQAQIEELKQRLGKSNPLPVQNPIMQQPSQGVQTRQRRRF